MRAIKMLLAAIALQVAVSASAQPVTLVGITNHVWAFETNGVDLGATWREVAFDDSLWPRDRGLFGGDGGYPYPFIVQINGMGGTRPYPLLPFGPKTVYYRTHFNWANPSTAGVVFNVTNFIDDGLVMYLNNVEIRRIGITDNPALYGSDAANIGEPGFRPGQIVLDTLPVNPLVSGDNVLAVEVHQNGTGSSDHVHGTSITAQQITAPCTDGIQPTNRTITVSRQTTFTLVQGPGCGIPNPTFQWYRILVSGGGEQLIVDATNANYTLVNAALGDAGQYYCRLSNLGGSIDTVHAILTVELDVTAPVFLSARVVGPGVNTFRLVVNEALCIDGLACGTDARFSFNWLINEPGTPIDDQGLGVATVFIYSTDPLTEDLLGTNIIFTTSSPRDPAKIYRIVAHPGESGIADRFGNFVASGAFIEVPAEVTAISVGPAGSALYTFDAAPEPREFATFAWAGGADGTETLADIDVEVQLLDAATITLQLAGVAGNPPAAGGMARWASDLGRLLTRPTGTEGDVILAHLRNDSGQIRSGLEIRYDLTSELPITEEAMNHLVYFSFTGAPASWQQVPPLTGGDGTSGPKTNILDFSAAPWAIGSELYILFLDDNGSGTPDTVNYIDNFRVLFPATDVPPSITQNPQSVTTNEAATVELTVVAAGSPPLSYQWFKGVSPLSNGGKISGATTASLTISNATPADNGNYFCRVSNNNPPNADSTAATVTIIPDTTGPRVTRVVSSANGTTITVAFNEPVNTTSAETEGNYTLVPAVPVSLATLGANNTVTLTTGPRTLGTAYSLRIANVTDAAAAANPVNPNPTIVSLTSASAVAGAGWADTWLYNSNNLDGIAWNTPGYVPDATWGTGPALFGFETGAGVLAAAPAPIATPLTPNTNTAAPNQLVTTYFRKTITLPALPAGASYVICHYTDDGFIAYLDGVEIPGGRFAMPAGAVTFTNRSGAIPTGDATMNTFSFTATAGDHLLAVELHQAGVNTSDVLFGMEVRVVGGPAPGLSISRAGNGDINLGWGADSTWQLRGSANVAGAYATTAIPAGTSLGTFTVPAASATNNFFYRLHYICLP